MTPLFTPERRSDQSAPRQGGDSWHALLSSPRFVLLTALMAIGVVGMYLATFVVRGIEVPPYGGIALVILSFMGLGMLVVAATSRPVGHVRLIDVVTCTFAAAIAQFLTREMGMPLLVAGAAIAVGLGLATLPGGPLDTMSSGAGYAGVCVGLLPPYVTQSSWLVIGAAILCGVLWSVIGPSVWNGIGGRMGSVAFISGSAIYLIADAFGMERSHRLVPLHMDALAHWSVVPVGMIAAVLTWVLVERAGMPFVLASGLLSLAVCIPLDLTQPVPASVMDAAFFGGTFVGGVSSGRLPNAAWVAGAGAIYGGLMLHFAGPLTGHVGVLGATGTIACLAMAGLEWLVLRPRLNEAAGRLVRRRRAPAR